MRKSTKRKEHRDFYNEVNRNEMHTPVSTPPVNNKGKKENRRPLHTTMLMLMNAAETESLTSLHLNRKITAACSEINDSRMQMNTKE